MRRLIGPLVVALTVALLVAGCDAGGGFGPPPPGVISLTTSISAGAYHAARVLLDGTLTTWGDNEYYQLGDGTEENRTTPVEIAAASVHHHWVAVSAGGFHTIAIARKDSDRTLWGWGLNLSGQAGYWWTDDPVTTPTQIGSGTDWEFVSAGYYHNAAIKEDGTLWTWGENWQGELGFDGGDTSWPTQVGEEEDWSFVSAGNGYTLGLRGSTLYAWGRNTWGQLGDGTTTLSRVPIEISSGWRQVSAGYTYSVGVKTDGTLWAWGGYGTYVYLGNGGSSGSKTPVQIGTDTDWEMAVANYEHTLAVKQDGSLWSWGEGASGQLGTDTLEEAEPTEVEPGTHWSLISLGWEFSLGLKSGHLHAWGDNGYGQLGIGSNDDQDTPEPL